MKKVKFFSFKCKFQTLELERPILRLPLNNFNEEKDKVTFLNSS